MDEDATLSAEVDLGAGHIVLDGVLALGERGIAAPRLFGPCLFWPRLPISGTAELLLVNLISKVHLTCENLFNFVLGYMCNFVFWLCVVLDFTVILHKVYHENIYK